MGLSPPVAHAVAHLVKKAVGHGAGIAYATASPAAVVDGGLLDVAIADKAGHSHEVLVLLLAIPAAHHVTAVFQVAPPILRAGHGGCTRPGRLLWLSVIDPILARVRGLAAGAKTEVLGLKRMVPGSPGLALLGYSLATPSDRA